MPTTPKAEATARRIADAAGELLFTNGYGATTIAEVADAAEVAAGTVMLHFGSKSALATAAFADRIAATVDAASQSISGASMAADLESLVRPLFEWYRANETVVGDLLKEALFADGPWAAYYAATVARTVETLAKIVERHDPHRPSQLVAESLLADYLLVVLQGLAGSFDSIDDQVDHFLALVDSR